MTSRLNRALGVCLSAVLYLGGCGGDGRNGFSLNGDAGAAEIRHEGLAAAYLSGRFALDAGNIANAAEQFDKAVTVDPENPELRTQLFLLRLAAGDFDGAKAAAKSLEDFETKPDDAVLLLAFDAFERGDLERAQAQFDNASGQGLNGLVMPFLQAWLDHAAGRTDEALSSLMNDGVEDGLSLVRDYHRSAMLQLAGKPAEALDLLSSIASDGEPLPTRLMLQRTALEQQVNDNVSAADFLDAQAQSDGGNVIREETQSILANGSIISSPINSPAEGMADALLSMGRALANQRGGGQAILLAQLAIYLAPTAADTRMFASELMLREDRLEDALTTLEPATSDPVFSFEARLVKASILRQMENYDEAADLLNLLAGEKPTRTDALIALGNMHSGNRDYEDAEIALSRAVERIGEPQPHDWRLYYSRGIAYERTKRWPRAEADFLKALELSPEQPFVLNYLGYSWVDQKLNLDEAKGMLRRAVELRPEDGFIVDSLGWAHYRLGDFEEAVVHLERAIELEPGDPVINDHLGDAYWFVGRKREAQYQWERAKIFDPEDDVLAAIEDKLANGLSESDEPG